MKRDERGSTFLGSCTPMTLSTDHVVKEKTMSGTRGTIILSMRDTQALPTKLAK